MSSKNRLVALLLSAALALPQSGLAEVSGAPAAPAVPDWREQNAYTLGVQAYVYAFPWCYMPLARWQRTVGDGVPVGALVHARQLVDATQQNGGAPNNDTLYSRAWVDLGDGPVILSVPALADRYYTVEMADFMGDNFAYVGTRATGTKAGNYAIVGPGWKGKLPAGVVLLPAAATRWVFILGRTYVSGASDLDAAHAIQDRYRLTPLAAWGRPSAARAAHAEVWKPLDPHDDPLADWKTINRAMAEMPPPAADAELTRAYARLGIGPGLDVEAADAATKRGLARAALDGRRLIAGAFTDGYLQKNVNGWNYPPPATGRPTASRDWLYRAVQMMAGFVANDPDEAVYLNVSVDGEGRLLTGKNRYEIRFAKGGEPEVGAFWSVTMYDQAYNLVANPINRYSIGDRSGLRPDPDGGLTIRVQKDRPGAGQDSNWLPAPDGPFFLILRTYLPGAGIVRQTWQPPSLTRLPD
jgi:hypothetical protein